LGAQPASGAKAPEKGKLEIDPMIGEEIHNLVVEFLGMSPEVKGKLQSALKGGKK
jgi:hypothetical protein